MSRVNIDGSLSHSYLKYLPCKHSFCYDCLYSYIGSHSNSTESRLGFHCPICRFYIPNKRDIDSPEEWTMCFPENFVLEKYAQHFGQRFSTTDTSLALR